MLTIENLLRLTEYVWGPFDAKGYAPFGGLYRIEKIPFCLTHILKHQAKSLCRTNEPFERPTAPRQVAVELVNKFLVNGLRFAGVCRTDTHSLEKVFAQWRTPVLDDEQPHRIWAEGGEMLRDALFTALALLEPTDHRAFDRTAHKATLDFEAMQKPAKDFLVGAIDLARSISYDRMTFEAWLQRQEPHH